MTQTKQLTINSRSTHLREVTDSAAASRAGEAFAAAERALLDAGLGYTVVTLPTRAPRLRAA